MKAVGLVVEYNPFHNGHLYHVQTAKTHTNSDIVIAVMSGNFLQRGEPAIVSKWARTKMALKQHVDIVVELPFMYAVQKAETFAKGAVSILHHLGTDYMFFGSENGDITPFHETVNHYQTQENEMNQQIKEQMRNGVSYPTAVANAFSVVNASENTLDLSRPNNILGFHYVKSIHDLKLPMIPSTTKRISSDYHELLLPEPTQQIASATSIRKAVLENNNLDTCTPFLPPSSTIQLKEYADTYGLWHSFEDYFSYLKYSLYTLSSSELAHIYEVEEGIEHRILRTIHKANSFQEYMEMLKTKRYTWTRLQRINTHILTRTNKKDMQSFLAEPVPYIRLLGMSKKGQTYLRKKKKDFTVPLISKLSSLTHPALQLDIKASYVYSLPMKEPLRTMFIEQEYAQSPIRYDEEQDQFLR